MTDTYHGVRRVTAAMVAAGVLLVACSDDGDEDTDPDTVEQDEETATADDAAQADDADDGSSDQTETAEEGSDGDADDEPSPTGSGGSPVGPDPATLADPIASYTHEVPDSSGGSVRVDITSMEIVGELLRVEITFVPDLPVHPGLTINEVLHISGAGSAAGVSPRLIDPHNLLEYRQVTNAMPNGTSFHMVDGVPRTFAFYFGQPVEDPPTFDLVLTSDFPTLTDVPYTP